MSISIEFDEIIGNICDVPQVTLTVTGAAPIDDLVGLLLHGTPDHWRVADVIAARLEEHLRARSMAGGS